MEQIENSQNLQIPDFYETLKGRILLGIFVGKP